VPVILRIGSASLKRISQVAPRTHHSTMPSNARFGRASVRRFLLLMQLVFLLGLRPTYQLGVFVHSQEHCSVLWICGGSQSACSNGLPGDDARGVDLQSKPKLPLLDTVSFMLSFSFYVQPVLSSCIPTQELLGVCCISRTLSSWIS
jgi:hypothetical protein